MAEIDITLVIDGDLEQDAAFATAIMLASGDRLKHTLRFHFQRNVVIRNHVEYVRYRYTVLGEPFNNVWEYPDVVKLRDIARLVGMDVEWKTRSIPNGL